MVTTARRGLRKFAGGLEATGSRMNAEVAVMALDCGELPLGGGFLALVRPALNGLEPGGMFAVLSRSPSVREDLSSWCRAERAGYLCFQTIAAGIQRPFIACREFYVPLQNAQER